MQCSGDKLAGDGGCGSTSVSMTVRLSSMQLMVSSILLAHAIAIRYKHVLNYTILLLVTHAVLQSFGQLHSSCSVAPWHWPAFLLP